MTPDLPTLARLHAGLILRADQHAEAARRCIAAGEHERAEAEALLAKYSR